ncbi:hypothetical protein BPMI_03710c [Candidatus Burkholderia pumila]|uniref:Uncharacterized protein n=1 Tax=Candidatus Burkholderia pumila TaxID=1090375 RepID=A0ABR5HKN0_9BURK|nr:hypothetical protein BPMI_03710c [Candidatus Burkholderia pumila]
MGTACAQDAANSSQASEQASQAGVLKVFDAQGKPIGPVESYERTQSVYLKFGQATVFIPLRHKKVSASQLSESQFEWANDTGATFSSSDCSGAPLIMIGSSPRPVEVVRTGADMTAYIAGPGYGSPLTTNSYISYDGSCLTGSRSVASYWTPQTSFPLTQHYPELLTVHY